MNREDQNKGFTIIELLIAIAILLIIMTVVYKGFTASTDGVRRAEAVDNVNSTARIIFLRMMDDISTAYLPDKNAIFVGEAKRNEKFPRDTINLTSLSNQIIVKDAKESELHEIGYFVKEDAVHKASGKDKAVSLYRREKKTIGKEPPLEGGNSYELTEEIAGIRFAYYDGSKWKDNWDSRTNKSLPKAVEVELILLDEDKKERSFRTLIDVPMGNR
ncbi:MAG: prepilin-type N-terminal cleavage/methylation domain-containing protein [Nitrospirae bacterium]|nr:prepilin-type N-terminal cleavage/methylation domain-containing protein [Nitrospirota bacterium]